VNHDRCGRVEERERDNHNFGESIGESWSYSDGNGFQTRSAAGAIGRDTPLATAIVEDQVRTHREIIRAGGWEGDRFMDCYYESFPARENGHLDQLRVHPRRVQHWGGEGLG